MALKRAGYTVAGWNRSASPLGYALSRGIIDEEARSLAEYDVVFVALPPKAAVGFINAVNFKAGAVVADVCGVKRYPEREIYSRPRAFKYVGCHPMAGKEVSGIENACAGLFDGASMVITVCPQTDKDALGIIRNLTKDMGFKYIVECSADVHDKKIAYTSQLAHIVANSYVKNGELEGCIGFTGGSFQDMTRIAGVDENVWASLYMLNADNLSENIGSLISSLEEAKDAIDEGNEEKLKEILRMGADCFRSGKNLSQPPYISVKKIN